jgi:hypothetical protein
MQQQQQQSARSVMPPTTQGTMMATIFHWGIEPGGGNMIIGGPGVGVEPPPPLEGVVVGPLAAVVGC